MRARELVDAPPQPAPPAEGGRGATSTAFSPTWLVGPVPLYFHALAPASAFEILAHRIVWTLLLCKLVVLAVMRDGGGGSARCCAGAGSSPAVSASPPSSSPSTGWSTSPPSRRAGRHRGGTRLLPQPHRHRRASGCSCSASGCGCSSGWRWAVGARRRRLSLRSPAAGIPWVALTLAVTFALYGLSKKRAGRDAPGPARAHRGDGAPHPRRPRASSSGSACAGAQDLHDRTAPLHPALLVLSRCRHGGTPAAVRRRRPTGPAGHHRSACSSSPR